MTSRLVRSVPGVRAARDVRTEGLAATHSGDLVRLPLAAALLLLAVLSVQRGHLSAVERDVFRLINDLPAILILGLWPIMQLGTMVAPAVVATVAAVVRRPRLAGSVLLAGYGAWAAAQIAKQLVERGRPADFLGDLPREWTSGGPGFVSGHMAVATALATVVAPSLTRPWRRVVWTLALTVGAARIYTGVHLPLDVVGGAAIGWFIGSLVHIGWGLPRRDLQASAVKAMLARFGLQVEAVEPVEAPARSSRPFRAGTADRGQLFVKVLDPDPQETDWILRLARVFTSSELRDVDALRSLPHQAEHEAAVAMAAHAAGVRVPVVVLARSEGAAAVVVSRHVPGRDLSRWPGEQVSDDLLRKVWQQVRGLHEALIAHRDLTRANVVVDEVGDPWLVDFGNAEAGANPSDMQDDVAELLASLALAVGPARAAATARDVLGQPALHAALPGLQPLALTAVTRSELRARPGVLQTLRREAGGTKETDALPAPVRLVVSGAVAVVGYGVLAVLAGWADVTGALTGVGWRWLSTAAVSGALMFLAAALVLVASSSYRLAAGRTAIAAAAGDAAQITAGPAERRAYLVRYVTRHGVRRDDAREAVDTLLVLQFVVPWLAAAVAGGFLLSDPDTALTASPTALMLIAASAVVAMTGALQRAPRGRRRSLTPEQARNALRKISDLARIPGRAIRTVGAATVELFAGAAVLMSALEAFGAPAAFVAPTFVVPTFVVFLTVAVTRALGVAGVPLVQETLLAAGLIILGVSEGPAVLGALTYGLFRFWVPLLVATVLRLRARSDDPPVPRQRLGSTTDRAGRERPLSSSDDPVPTHSPTPGDDATVRFGLVGVGAAVAFAVLSVLVAVSWSPLRTVDQAVVDAVNGAVSGNATLVGVILDLTDLGGGVISWALLLAAAAWSLARGGRWLALFVVVAGLGAAVIDEGFKELLHRARPVVEEPVAHVAGPSFPSGHAVTATVTFAVLLVVFLPAVPARLRRGVVAGAAALVAAVGLTRVALGVHFPSDVVGGWLLGLLWLVLTAAAFQPVLTAWRHSPAASSPGLRGAAPVVVPRRGWARVAVLPVAAVMLWGVAIGVSLVAG